MKIATKFEPLLAALVLSLAGCATGGMQQTAQRHLSAAQCRDLTDLRNKGPATHERSMSELTALRSAGYHPEWRFDPYYPADLEAAQRQVNIWYETECTQAQPG